MTRLVTERVTVGPERNLITGKIVKSGRYVASFVGRFLAYGDTKAEAADNCTALILETERNSGKEFFIFAENTTLRCYYSNGCWWYAPISPSIYGGWQGCNSAGTTESECAFWAIRHCEQSYGGLLDCVANRKALSLATKANVDPAKV